LLADDELELYSYFEGALLSACEMFVLAYQGLKAKVISETPAHKQGNRLQMKLELRQKRLSMDPSSMVVVAESPVKYSSDTGIVFYPFCDVCRLCITPVFSCCNGRTQK
jgi:hypothetical protein